MDMIIPSFHATEFLPNIIADFADDQKGDNIAKSQNKAPKYRRRSSVFGSLKKPKAEPEFIHEIEANYDSSRSALSK